MFASASRSSTLDSSISAPTSEQLDHTNGVAGSMSSMSSSSASLAKRSVLETSSNDFNQQFAQRPEFHTQTSHLRSPSPPPPTPSQSAHPAPPAAPSQHLSGLVCNVHRTTGREPPPLVGASTTILGDKLYVFGGRRISRSRPVLTADLYELDLLRRHWIRVDAKGQVPPPRYFHSICTLGDSKLVCYGGMSPELAPGATLGEPEGQVSVMADIHIYDVPSKTWLRVEIADGPQGRYAHCAAILPSSAVFSSANAPLSAIHHNPSDDQPNRGTIGTSLDGTGGAEMVVVGGQDSSNGYIDQISIFNLRSLKWTSTTPTTGRSCGAYRSVVTPLTSMKSSDVGVGVGKGTLEDDDAELPTNSGSPMLIYTNYNFLDVKLELQIRKVDGTIADKSMQGPVSPPGLRFPSGGVIDNHFVVAGTFLTSSKQEFALWALDLRTLTWAKIDVASSIFSSGSWNRGVLWSRRNAFVILGSRKRNLVEDYNNRRLNFSNICLVQLEAFGLYDNARKLSPLSGYVSVSAPAQERQNEEIFRGGAQLFPRGVGLGEDLSSMREMADMEFTTLDGTRMPVNSRLLARRWGPMFNLLMQEANPAYAAPDTITLRPSAASVISRNSSITITPSFQTTSSGGTTLLPGNSSVGDVTSNDLTAPPDIRAFTATGRPRIIYLPHTVPTVSALIYFLYTSTLPPIGSPLTSPQILCSLLQLARPYKIEGLLEAVVERLHESLDGRNAAAIFNAAAMAAGAGDGASLANSDLVNAATAATTSTGSASRPHPPRTASLAGIPLFESGESGNSGPSTTASASSSRPSVAGMAGDRNTLRIDTQMANGPRRPTTGRSPLLSPGGSATTTGDEDDGSNGSSSVPNSASTSASMSSHMSGAAAGFDTDGAEVWNGGWSAVIGLQKRGLRGLMEGRRLRERGAGPPAAGAGAAGAAGPGPGPASAGKAPEGAGVPGGASHGMVGGGGGPAGSMEGPSRVGLGIA